MSEALPADVQTYIRKVRMALNALPETVRDDLIRELHSHLIDRLESGASASEAIAPFGSPEQYASSLYNAQQLSGALVSRRMSELIDALIRNLTSSISATIAGLLIFCIWVMTGVLCVVAIAKAAAPQHVGLWQSPTEFFIGVIDEPASATELLGFWIFPIAIIATIFAWLLTRMLALWGLQSAS